MPRPSPEGNRPNPPATEDPAALGFTPRPPVRWLAPAMLVRTGAQVAVSELFGTFTDRRELQSIEPADPLDLSDAAPGEEFWFDYVADIGDGFDATTTVASQLAADELELGPGDGGRAYRTKAGELLVMGGDECYPVASRANYTDRMVGPYRMMLPWTERPRWLVALPGNHDWYDGLTSFLKQFCQRRWIGGWKTAQTRSYFAVKLPGGWWLWGIDIQLGDDIDEAQLDYFRAVAERVDPDDAIILCWAMPSWVESGPENPEGYAPLEYFERTVIPNRAMLRVSLSGDYHHYSRYQGEDEAAEQKITAGGGGAFLFGTHHLPDELRLPPAESHDVNKRPPVTYRLRRCYPSKPTSRRLRWGIFGSVYHNPGFWAVPAAVYLLIGVALGRAFPYLATDYSWTTSVSDLVLAIVLVVATWLGLAAFTGLSGRQNAARRRAVSGAHLLGHLVLVVAVVVGAEVGADALGWVSAWRTAAVPIAEGVVGGLLGPAVVALYLMLADRVGPSGVNTTELFSAQAIQDYKCFLRLRIDPGGALTIFPVKIERVVRWSFSGAERGERRWYRPAGGVEP
ncbi:MAG: metallophosphoesterase, partial [Pseudonocardia sp.]|nr:metallophosphoesterase [Pseudonocardia sp.]